MPRARLRLVVDTNVLISWLIGRRLRELDTVLMQEEFQLCFSTRSLAELAEVTRRPRMRKYFTQSRAEESIERLARTAHIVKWEPKVVPVCRDAKDDFLLWKDADHYTSLIAEGLSEGLVQLTGDIQGCGASSSA